MRYARNMSFVLFMATMSVGLHATAFDSWPSFTYDWNCEGSSGGTQYSDGDPPWGNGECEDLNEDNCVIQNYWMCNDGYAACVNLCGGNGYVVNWSCAGCYVDCTCRGTLEPH